MKIRGRRGKEEATGSEPGLAAMAPAGSCFGVGKTFPFPKPPGFPCVRPFGSKVRPAQPSFVLNFPAAEAGIAWCQPHPTWGGREGWMGSAGNSRRLEGPGRNEEKKKRHLLKKPPSPLEKKPPSLPVQGCFGEGGRVTVVCAVRGRSQQQSLSPSPSAAFHGGFLTRGGGCWITKIS